MVFFKLFWWHSFWTWVRMIIPWHRKLLQFSFYPSIISLFFLFLFLLKTASFFFIFMCNFVSMAMKDEMNNRRWIELDKEKKNIAKPHFSIQTPPTNVPTQARAHTKPHWLIIVLISFFSIYMPEFLSLMTLSVY